MDQHGNGEEEKEYQQLKKYNMLNKKDPKKEKENAIQKKVLSLLQIYEQKGDLYFFRSGVGQFPIEDKKMKLGAIQIIRDTFSVISINYF